MYFDDKTPSFGIRVGKNRKTWIALKGPNRTKVRLGHYPALSLADARRKALITLGSPLHRTTGPRFEAARDEFLALDRWRPRSKYQIQRTLRKYFHWQKTLDKITHNDVASVIDSIKAQSEAGHALKDIKTFFSWCAPRYIPHSPCEGLKAPAKYTPRQRVLSTDEIRAAWTIGGRLGAIIKLLLLTGQRRNEVISLHSDFINGDLITLPAALTKNGREHLFPHGKFTREILNGLPTEGLLFPGENGSPYRGIDKAKNALHVSWTLHDLRRTFATLHAQIGTPIHVTEKLLNHVSGSHSGIVAVYQRHTYLPEMREAVDKYEKWLISLLSS